MIVDCNEPDIQEGEHLFQIVAGFNIVSAKSGQILDNDAVDFSCLHIIHHSGKFWPRKVSSCVTIIHIGIHQHEIRSGNDIVQQHFLLVLHGISVLFPVVFKRKAKINCRPEYLSIRNFRNNLIWDMVFS